MQKEAFYCFKLRVKKEDIFFFFVTPPPFPQVRVDRFFFSSPFHLSNNFFNYPNLESQPACKVSLNDIYISLFSF